VGHREEGLHARRLGLGLPQVLVQDLGHRRGKHSGMLTSFEMGKCDNMFEN
jgi:hypothetical protein